MRDMNTKKIIQIASLSVFFLLIAIYAFFRSHYLIFGIEIVNVNIADGATITDPILKITGNAKNATNLTLNGREILIDENGNFNETIALLSGYNIISIRAQDKFGYVDERNYKLIH
jgi:hypothetical protein